MIRYCRLEYCEIIVLALIAISANTSHGQPPDPAKMSFRGFVWPNQTPHECPFEPTEGFTGVYFTGRNSDYHCGDTFYPTWGEDGHLYSPFADGTTDGVGSGSGFPWENTGNVVMMGDDPQHLVIKNTAGPQKGTAYPYGGRYPCGSLVHDGVWYYGTYCLGATKTAIEDGYHFGWPIMGPMPGFRVSHDKGKTWSPSPLTPENPLFPEPKELFGPVKIGAPHFVDFGRNMEHSPDGKAYLVCMGAEESDPHPRFANLSWCAADQVYLIRVTPSVETINSLDAYEFFAGHDEDGNPLWTSDFEKIEPLLDWNNHMGCVTATYNAPLQKYFMCVTDGWRTRSNMDSYILEADTLTGPWRMVTYMQEFGTQGYFLNFPSKFISDDGKTMWLCYSGNYGAHTRLPRNPPNGRYGLCLYEIRLLGEGKQQFLATRAWKDPANVARNAKLTASSVQEGSSIGALTNGVVSQRSQGITDQWVAADGAEDAWVTLEWDAPQQVRSMTLFDDEAREDHVKYGRIEFSNGHVIPIRVPLPNSNVNGLDIFWGDKKEVTWMKVVFDRVEPSAAPASLSEIAVFQ